MMSICVCGKSKEKHDDSGQIKGGIFSKGCDGFKSDKKALNELEIDIFCGLLGVDLEDYKNSSILPKYFALYESGKLLPIKTATPISDSGGANFTTGLVVGEMMSHNS